MNEVPGNERGELLQPPELVILKYEPTGFMSHD